MGSVPSFYQQHFHRMLLKIMSGDWLGGETGPFQILVAPRSVARAPLRSHPRSLARPLARSFARPLLAYPFGLTGNLMDIFLIMIPFRVDRGSNLFCAKGRVERLYGWLPGNLPPSMFINQIQNGSFRARGTFPKLSQASPGFLRIPQPSSGQPSSAQPSNAMQCKAMSSKAKPS